MKFTADKDIGRKVKVIAWCVPGIGPGLHQHLVCGEVGTLVKIKETPTTPDGNYKVQLKGGEWWFRACDIVDAESACTCDDTAKKVVTDPCIVHDRPDPDPADEAGRRLLAMEAELSRQDYGDNRFKCITCGQGFSSAEEINDHIDANHNEGYGDDDPTS